jgi:transcriptional regulator with XRE-family HTH domain
MTRIRSSSTTAETVQELGARLRAYRLTQNRTIDELAVEAGVGRATLGRAEAGENPRLDTVVRILRALGRLEALETFLPAPLVSPLELAAQHGHIRQRARHKVPARKREATPAQTPASASERTHG